MGGGHCGCGEGSLDRWQGILVLLKDCVSQQRLSVQTQRGLKLSFLSPRVVIGWRWHVRVGLRSMALSSALRFAVVGLGCSWFVLEYCMATAVGGRSVSELDRGGCGLPSIWWKW